MNYSNERPIEPDLSDLINAWIEQHLENLHTAMPGKIHAIDATNGTVDVEPLVRHGTIQPDGSTVYDDLPILPAVPLVMPRLGEWFVSIPASVGDYVLVVFCESAIGTWRVGDGSLQYPGDLDRHTLSHGVAIPGLIPRSATFTTGELSGDVTADMMLGHAIVSGITHSTGTQLTFKSDGSLVISQGGQERFKIDSTGVITLAGGTATVNRQGDAVSAATTMNTWISAVTSYINGVAPGTLVLPTDFGITDAGAPNVKA